MAANVKPQEVLPELRGRVSSLDGLRAISIFMVLLGHAGRSCGFPEGVPSWPTWLFNGPLGVRIFFVISGFIITLLLLKEENTSGSFSIRGFYIRRIFRILPVYYLFLFAIMLLARLGHLQIEDGELMHAFTFTTGLWMGPSWMLGHTWSLSVEEQFYLLWPVTLFLVATPRKRLLLVLACIAVYPVMRVLVYLSPFAENRSYLFITQGDAIVFGCLLAILLFYYASYVTKYFTQNVMITRVICLFLIGLSNAIQSKAMLGMITVPLSNTIESLSIAWLIGSFIFNRDTWFSVLNSRPMIFLGTVSYSWYLWQQLFLFECGAYFSGMLFTFPVNIVASFVAAVASYYLVEKTSERLKKYLMTFPALSGSKR